MPVSVLLLVVCTLSDVFVVSHCVIKSLYVGGGGVTRHLIVVVCKYMHGTYLYCRFPALSYFLEGGSL